MPVVSRSVLVAVGLFVAVVCVARPAACPSDLFLQRASLPTSGAPNDIVIADFNGDGVPDLAVTGDYFLSIWLGNGDGTFAPPIDLGDAGYAIASADFDGDGVPDIALGRTGDVEIFRGNGNGTFQAPVPYSATGGIIRFVVAADLDGNGKPDLVVDDSGFVAILINAGDGTFGAPSYYSLGNGTRIGVGDSDGDGKPDIVTAGPEVSVLRNLGNGAFGAPTPLVLAPSLSVAVGDVNADGIADIVFTIGDSGSSGFGGSIAVMIGNGDGTFQAPVETLAGFAPNRLVLADLDGDGLLDAAAILGGYNFGPNEVVVLRGTGTAVFGPVTRYFAGDTAVTLAVADLQSDGPLDLVTGNYTGGDVSLLFGNGGGRLRSYASIPAAPSFNDTLVVGDFDGDGLLDVVAGGDPTKPLMLVSGHGDGTFAVPRPIPGAGGAGNGAAAGDFDRDGLLDLAAVTASGTTILLGNGDGTFRTGQSDGNYLVSGTGDFNGDGIVDLLANQGSNQAAVVALGAGDGTFPAWVATPLEPYWYFMIPFDIDGDGKSDVAYLARPGPFESGSIHVLLANGDGTFRETSRIAVEPASMGIAFAELTGDGKVDMVSAEGSAGTKLYPGNGDGTFRPPSTLDSQSASSVQVADFDGDGVLDLITTSSDAVAARFFRGLPGGGFDAPVTFADAPGPAVTVAPLAGSRPDVLVTNSGAFSVLVNARLVPALSNRSAVTGAMAIWRVAASGRGALKYQWRRGGLPLSDGGTVSGAHTGTLTISPISFADAGSYDVVVTDACGQTTSNPATLSVEFLDVPVSSPFHADILTIATAGITSGCGGGNYCPTSPVRRDQMAVFLLKSEHGSSYVPPACTGVFADVPCPSPFADWVERLAAEGVTSGCGNGNYCPSSSVTRAQMAVFLLKTKNGSTYVPPPATGIFGDVPVGSFAADFIEALYNQSITGGCQASPLLYCPGNSVLRQQMATFLVRTFAP